MSAIAFLSTKSLYLIDMSISTDKPILRSPFPWFGGKSRAAPLIWSRLGNPINFVEPFAGSLATLLLRQDYDPLLHTETVNDLDCYVANFWRALSFDPEAVAHWADAPVNEADLSARHLWLVNQSEFQERMKTDPDYFDVKIAGWWVWGICSWIGSGWCATINNGRVNRKLPHLGDNGQGVHRQRPHLSDNGQGDSSHSSELLKYFDALAYRLRRVRVCCGDWQRVMGASPTDRLGVTGILLDPPYDQTKRRSNLYAVETQVSSQVREWAIANGHNPLLRIALCGLVDEHEMLDSWECCEWKAVSGYGGDNGNPKKERIWFSPHCLKPSDRIQFSLF